MNNGNWLQSNRLTPRNGHARESGPPNAGWAETEPFLEDMLDIDPQYTSQFNGPSFPPTRSTHQTNGQYGYRGRLQNYGGVAGNPPRAAEPLGSPFDAFRTPGNTRQNGVNRSWPDLNSPEPRRSNISPSLENPRGDSRHEIMNLKHRVVDLEERLAKNDELGVKVADLEDKVAKLIDLKLGDLVDKLAQWEENFGKQMKENNETISGWLGEIKVTMERFMVGETRRNGGSRNYPRTDIWDGPMVGDDEEGQGMLSGAQSATFDLSI